MKKPGKTAISTGLAVLIAAGIAGTYQMIPDTRRPHRGAAGRDAGDSNTPRPASPGNNQLTNSSGAARSPHNSGSQSSGPPKSAPAMTNAADGPAPHSEGPAVTRATRRDAVVTSSGVRKSLVDPMASWQNLPPWPEGPRLFAEVETSARKYVNLRPDDVGELPRVLAAAKERIELRVNFPEGTPGEKIFVEIPNGGSFPDTGKFGRIFDLPANRTLSFPFITDDSRGYCTVNLRHRGHGRSLPIWVGEPPETDS